jgi:hypothetical protein
VLLAAAAAQMSTGEQVSRLSAAQLSSSSALNIEDVKRDNISRADKRSGSYKYWLSAIHELLPHAGEYLVRELQMVCVHIYAKRGPFAGNGKTQ